MPAELGELTGPAGELGNLMNLTGAIVVNLAILMMPAHEPGY